MQRIVEGRCKWAILEPGPRLLIQGRESHGCAWLGVGHGVDRRAWTGTEVTECSKCTQKTSPMLPWNVFFFFLKKKLFARARLKKDPNLLIDRWRLPGFKIVIWRVGDGTAVLNWKPCKCIIILRIFFFYGYEDKKSFNNTLYRTMRFIIGENPGSAEFWSWRAS